MKYPKQIFVQRENSGSEEYLNAQVDATECDDGEVAVYGLLKVVKKTTETTLTDKS